MFKDKRSTDVEYIKAQLLKEIEYYRSQAKAYRAMYEKEEDPYVKLVLKKTWWQFNNVAVEFEGIYWQFEKADL